MSYFIFSFCHLQLFGSVLWVPGWWGQHHVRNSRKIDQVQVINTLFAINFLTFPVGSWIPIIFFQFESGLIWIVLTVLLFEWIVLLIFDLQDRISKEILITRTFFSSHSRSSNFGNRIPFLQKFNFLQITNLDFFFQLYVWNLLFIWPLLQHWIFAILQASHTTVLYCQTDHVLYCHPPPILWLLRGRQLGCRQGITWYLILLWRHLCQKFATGCL